MPAAAFQDIGDRLTKALLSGDFALYRSLIVLPLTLTPRNGDTYELSDETCLQADFEQYHAVLVVHGVTDIFRDVQSVTTAGPDRTVIQVMTHILQRANRVADPFVTRFFLRRDGDSWRIFEIESSGDHLSWSQGNHTPGFGWV